MYENKPKPKYQNGENKETYLTIHLVGHQPIKAWRNNERTNERQPQYKAEGVAVWVNVKTVQPKEPDKCDEVDVEW